MFSKWTERYLVVFAKVIALARQYGVPFVLLEELDEPTEAVSFLRTEDTETQSATGHLAGNEKG